VALHYDTDGLKFPACLPDTLEGLSTFSTAQIKWTCPPRLSFLHVVTDSCACVMYANMPPNHASLQCLVIGIYPICGPYVEPQHSEAYLDWLSKSSLPAVEILSLYGNLRSRDLVDVARLIVRLPRLKRLYINFNPLKEDTDEGWSSGPEQMTLEQKALCLDMLEASLPPSVHFDRRVLAPNLEAQFLLDHGLSILSPCTDPHVIVEPEQGDADKPPKPLKLLQLQPALVRQHQRRKTEK
jgi:hypothetical protein